MFNESDADGNGRLNRQEYRTLVDKVQDEAREKGQFVEPVPEHFDITYDLFNEISGGEEGFTYQEQLSYSGKMMAMYGELKAADEAAAQE